MPDWAVRRRIIEQEFNATVVRIGQLQAELQVLEQRRAQLQGQFALLQELEATDSLPSDGQKVPAEVLPD